MLKSDMSICVECHISVGNAVRWVKLVHIGMPTIYLYHSKPNLIRILFRKYWKPSQTFLLNHKLYFFVSSEVKKIFHFARLLYLNVKEQACDVFINIASLWYTISKFNAFGFNSIWQISVLRVYWYQFTGDCHVFHVWLLKVDNLHGRKMWLKQQQ